MSAIQDRIATLPDAFARTKWPWPIVLSLIVLAIAVPWQTRWGVIPDTSWIITLCERMLAGDRLYVDLIETNPPFTLWLYMPAVYLANLLGVAPEYVVHEGRAETGRERRFRFDNALFGAGDLGRIARKEVIHRLRRRQPGDRRHHAEGVGGQPSAGSVTTKRAPLISPGFVPGMFSAVSVPPCRRSPG